MNITQLNPPLWLETPKGQGLAHFVTWATPEQSLYWTVFIGSTGEIWTFENEKVRACKNVTLDRVAPVKPQTTEDAIRSKLPQAPV